MTHNQLGNTYAGAGDLDRALPHYREAVRYREAAGDPFGAAQTRFNVAVGLAHAGRFEDALEYARAALRDYQTYGEGATAEIGRAERLIADIEQAMQ